MNKKNELERSLILRTLKAKLVLELAWQSVGHLFEIGQFHLIRRFGHNFELGCPDDFKGVIGKFLSEIKKAPRYQEGYYEECHRRVPYFQKSKSPSIDRFYRENDCDAFESRERNHELENERPQNPIQSLKEVTIYWGNTLGCPCRVRSRSIYGGRCRSNVAYRTLRDLCLKYATHWNADAALVLYHHFGKFYNGSKPDFGFAKIKTFHELVEHLWSYLRNDINGLKPYKRKRPNLIIPFILFSEVFRDSYNDK